MLWLLNKENLLDGVPLFLADCTVCSLLFNFFNNDLLTRICFGFTFYLEERFC